MPRKTRLIKLDMSEAVIETTLVKYGHSYVVRVPRDVGVLFQGSKLVITIRRAGDGLSDVGGGIRGSSNYISGDEFVRCVDECRGLSGREGDLCVKRCLGVV